MTGNSKASRTTWFQPVTTHNSTGLFAITSWKYKSFTWSYAIFNLAAIDKRHSKHRAPDTYENFVLLSDTSITCGPIIQYDTSKRPKQERAAIYSVSTRQSQQRYRVLLSSRITPADFSYEQLSMKPLMLVSYGLHHLTILGLHSGAQTLVSKELGIVILGPFFWMGMNPWLSMAQAHRA